MAMPAAEWEQVWEADTSCVWSPTWAPPGPQSREELSSEGKRGHKWPGLERVRRRTPETRTSQTRGPNIDVEM